MGIDELLNVTVSVENLGENAYNALVVLTYPADFSFRKFAVLQVGGTSSAPAMEALLLGFVFSTKGRIECNSLDSESGLTRGKTDCTVDKPILRSNATVSWVPCQNAEATSCCAPRVFRNDYSNG